ncbi:MAG: hypothetical protein AB2535_21215 [Candidatus Thiodiazotropha endolucinida]
MKLLKAINRHRPICIRRYLVLMLLIVPLLLAACGESHAKKPKKKNFIQHGDYIHFELGGEKLKVRKAYFRGGGENQWGVLKYADFWALLPDFETYDKTKNRYEFVDRLGWGRRLYISLHARKASRVSLSEIIELNTGKNGGKRFSGKLGRPDEIKYGLEVYHATYKAPDDYLYRPEGKTVMYMKCGSKKMDVPRPHCKMMWDHSDKVYADAVFSKDYLPQWREILADIEQVINGQDIQGANDGVNNQ